MILMFACVSDFFEYQDMCFCGSTSSSCYPQDEQQTRVSSRLFPRLSCWLSVSLPSARKARETSSCSGLSRLAFALKRAPFPMRCCFLSCVGQVFDNTRCDDCGGYLELPSVFFACSHAFHLYCLTQRNNNQSNPDGSEGQARPPQSAPPPSHPFHPPFPRGGLAGDPHQAASSGMYSCPLCAPQFEAKRVRMTGPGSVLSSATQRRLAHCTGFWSSDPSIVCASLSDPHTPWPQCRLLYLENKAGHPAACFGFPFVSQKPVVVLFYTLALHSVNRRRAVLGLHRGQEKPALSNLSADAPSPRVARLSSRVCGTSCATRIYPATGVCVGTSPSSVVPQGSGPETCTREAMATAPYSSGQGLLHNALDRKAEAPCLYSAPVCASVLCV